MEYIFIGIVTAVNFIFILFKVKKDRFQDAFIDLSIFIFVVIIFSGTYGGMAVGMVASMIVSIYLYTNPPDYFKSKLNTNAMVKRTIAAAKDLNINGPLDKKYNKWDDL